MGVWIETSLIDWTISSSESHPTWVCGLKHKKAKKASMRVKSHPTWVCGLKHLLLSINAQLTVTPYVGVWIETDLSALSIRATEVTPYVGVWIETC